MNIEDLKGRFFLGNVTDNNDPQRLGRVKVKVIGVFDSIPDEALPWCSPWKGLNGEDFILPEKGKIITVIFESSIYTPEYIFAEHYNVNLQEKLKSLSSSDYTSMKSLLFDSVTQVYSNESEGLILDHKFNNINITNSSINLNLKDNSAILSLGDSKASESAVLGDRFFRWFDKLMDNLAGKKQGPYLGNLGAQVIPNPEFLKLYQEYITIKNTFKSDHVKIVDDNQIRKKSRIANPQIGDNWTSTVSENPIEYKDISKTIPMQGSTSDIDDFNQPSNPSTNDTDYPSSPVSNNRNKQISIATPEEIEKIIKILEKKKYTVYTKPYQPNIVSIRTKTQTRVKVSNNFDDYMFVFFKDNKNNWTSYKYPITTTPGLHKEDGVKFKTLKPNVSVLKLGQYTNKFTIGIHNKEYPALVNRSGLPCLKQEPTNYYNFSAPDKTGFGINIHKAGPNSVNVYNWSEGCQVFQKESHFDEFLDICRNWESIQGKGAKFTYTLLSENDIA